jgi:hypothetical protein
MNEQEFSRALHGAMATIEAPPPMNGTEMLDAAKRAQHRRRATLAGVASAAAVVLIAVGAVFGSTLPDSGPVGTAPADLEHDATGTANPDDDKSRRLIDLLIASAPAGMEVGAEPRPRKAQPFGVAGRHYSASIPVGRSDRFGTLEAEVFTPGHPFRGTVCELTKQWWAIDGECQPVTVGDKQVGVTTSPTGKQAASYRHTDDTVVFIGQSLASGASPLSLLPELPLSTQALAALAVDPKFRLD